VLYVVEKGVEVEMEHNSRTSWIRDNYTYLLDNLDAKNLYLVRCHLMYSRGRGRVPV